MLCPIRDNYWSNIYVGNIEDNLANRYPFLRTNDPSTNPVEMQKYLTEGEMAYFEERRAQAVEFIRNNPSGGFDCIPAPNRHVLDGILELQPRLPAA